MKKLIIDIFLNFLFLFFLVVVVLDDRNPIVSNFFISSKGTQIDYFRTMLDK